MTTATELREAFSHQFTFRVGDPDDSHMLSVISDAARGRLAQLEGKALVIEPDEEGDWPEWAVKEVSGYTMHFATTILDALRDAMPPEDAE